MAGDTQSWVAQYGDALANLDSYTKNITNGPGQPGAPVVAPAQQGAFAQAAQAGAPAPQGGALTPSVPGATPPPSGGALAPPGAQGAAPGKPALPSAGLPPPADMDSDHPYNWHNLWKKAPDAQKEKIADQLEQNGVNIDQKFKQLQSDGVINAPTADYGRTDMAGFIMEAGLRMAQAGAKGDYNSNPFASAATGILGAVESRRDRQLQAGQMAFQQRNAQYERELELAKLNQGERLGELQRDTQIQIAKENEAGRAATAQTSANARIKAAQTLAGARTTAASIEANKPTANNTITDENGNVFWKGGGNAGKPVMVDDGNGGQRQIKVQQKTAAGAGKAAFTEKDVESATSKHESDLNKNQFTSKIDDGSGKQIPWAKATEAQKQAHLAGYASTVRARAASAAPAAGGAQAAANPYAKFVKGGAAPASAAPAAKQAPDQDDAENEVATGDDDDDTPAKEQ